MSAPELRLPVEAHGHLRLDAPSGRTLRLDAEGDVLRADVPTWTELKDLSPGSWSSRLAMLRHLAALLSTCALRLELQSNSRTVLELGHGIRPNWLARIAGLGSARISAAAFGLMRRR